MGQPDTSQRYSPEFKAEAVRLVRTSDEPVTEIARDLGRDRDIAA